MEVLGGETLIALAIELLHFLRLRFRNRPSRAPSKPAIDKPLITFRLKPVGIASERPVAHPQNLRRLELAQPTRFPTRQNIPQLDHPKPL
jgi:hypothetical protein